MEKHRPSKASSVGSNPTESTYTSLYDAKTVSNEIPVILYSSEKLFEFAI